MYRIANAAVIVRLLPRTRSQPFLTIRLLAVTLIELVDGGQWRVGRLLGLDACIRAAGRWYIHGNTA